MSASRIPFSRSILWRSGISKEGPAPVISDLFLHFSNVAIVSNDALGIISTISVVPAVSGPEGSDVAAIYSS